MMVFAAHSHPQLLRSGFFGVDMFCPRGFLITSILLNEHRAAGRIDILRFYVRRALRLWPALFIMVASVVAIVMVATSHAPVLSSFAENDRAKAACEGIERGRL